MKRLIYITIALALLAFASKPKKLFTTPELLMGHQWTLVEFKETKKDTITNLTSFFLPCEKDNYTKYSNNNYTIYEGPSKCDPSNNDVKGSGSWTYNQEENIIIDRYEKGREIWKRVAQIDNESLVLEFEGEGRKVFRQTYFSETGAQKEENAAIIMDNSDPASILMNLINDELKQVDQCVVAGLKDLGKTNVTLDDRQGSLTKILVYPFTSSYKNKNVKPLHLRSKELTDLGTKNGLDYVISGNILESSAKMKKENYEALVKAEITVYDIKNNFSETKTFTFAPQPEVNTRQLLNAATTILVAGSVANSLRYSYRSRYYYGYYFPYNSYGTYATVNALNEMYYINSTFSNTNAAIRKASFDSTNAILEAIEDNKKNVVEHVVNTSPLLIKINKIEGEGKKAVVTIEAGSLSNLEKNDVLNVYRYSSIKLSNGSTETSKVKIGELTVNQVLGSQLSTCSISKERDDVLKAWAAYPNEIKLGTTSTKKKSGFKF